MEVMIDPAAVPPGTSMLLVVEEQSQIGAARRSAIALGNAHKLSVDAVGRLALVVTEAATNIVKHARRGVIVLRGLVAGHSAAIEVLALDKGPGISEVGRAMRDGYSTSGTAGQGLGAIRRLADVFEIHSQPHLGTALLARIGERAHPLEPASVDDRVGAVCVPLRGETECGDAWRIVIARQRISVLLVDGLGHGPGAAAAAAIATTAFARVAAGSPDRALSVIDMAMRGTRGAALSVVMIDEAARTTGFSGVGNVDGRVFTDGQPEHLIPQNGIVGHTMPVPRTVGASWPVGGRLVMHSDGVSGRWRMDSYPGLATAHPGLLAGVLYRDFARERDDATVLVVGDSTAGNQRAHRAARES